MQPVQPRYDRPEPNRNETDRPRIRRGDRGRFVSVVTSVGFWAGISILVALISLSLPWYGVTVQPPGTYSWGLFPGPQSQMPNVLFFFQDTFSAALASGNSLMAVLVLLTLLATVIGAVLKRRLALAIALALSTITILSYLGEVSSAVSSQCQGSLTVLRSSCISSLTGQAAYGAYVLTWGFQAGFYTFIASTILLFGTLALKMSK